MLDMLGTKEIENLLQGNLVTWRSRKQKVISCSSAEVEYQAMASSACEMVWL